MAAPRERAVPVQHPSIHSPARHAQPLHDHLAREGEDVATGWPKVAA